jgi:hypothetical protein
MNWLPDDVKEASGGETIDQMARDSIKLAHLALDRFPELMRRHKVIAGGAAITSSLVILAGVALAKRIRGGQTPDEALAGVTEEELEQLKYLKHPPRRVFDTTPDSNGVGEESPPACVG